MTVEKRPERHNVAILGPKGATFSFRAAKRAAKLLNWPKFDFDTGFVEVERNEHVLDQLLSGAATYGIIAAETKVRRRIDESLETFARLIEKYHNGDCPIKIVAAIRMKLSFALLAKHGTKRKDIRVVRAHKQAFGACTENIKKAGWSIQEEDSNGTAALKVARSESSDEAALGPIEAARLFGLDVLDESAEDTPAVTTFFVLGPSRLAGTTGEENRALIMFRLADHARALTDAINPFGQVDLSLSYLHSFYGGMEHHKDMYNFISEMPVSRSQIRDLEIALPLFHRVTTRSIVMGPFAVLDVDA